jgi:HAE1 family hydrophobic/amphiphilic exporter-1
MGATVFAGMIGVTAAGLFLTPVFYLLVQKRRGRAAERNAAAAGPLLPAPAVAVESSHV